MYAKRDKNGPYIEIEDNDRDLVTLTKQGDKYVYRIRGEAINKLARLESFEMALAIRRGIKKGDSDERHQDCNDG